MAADSGDFAWKDTDIDLERELGEVNWPALVDYALIKKQTMLGDPEMPIACQLADKYNAGGRNVLRLLSFSDDTKWIVRLRRRGGELKSSDWELRFHSEVATMRFLAEKTRIRVPQVYAYETSELNPVGAAFILMEFLDGINAIDAFGGLGGGGQVPKEHHPSFFPAVAELQAEISSVRSAKIGSIVQLDDGTYDIGPIPDLGGPFSTAAEFLAAWCRRTPFNRTASNLRAVCDRQDPDLAEPLVASAFDFPKRLEELLPSMALRPGPFPLMHGDFSHHNFLVDAANPTQIAAVVDWEQSTTVPWELLRLPLFLPDFPDSLLRSWEVRIDRDNEAQAALRAEYIGYVAEAEKVRGLDKELSSVLGDRRSQDLAVGMDFWENEGKPVLYEAVLEAWKELEESGEE
ncbi:uncharacterized protein BDZ99DRAFT_388052 [Mytilinidion resinicola]|uniref:Aminoglycoside phosphotransferase domain-containing protein n=1 Tax=Mytilinidion resinicola TaxID=574789 RepID=A0A6A6YKW2_9PEZI|nr:uncharacterized protein BDZ99DRAFT_388052 [Mytilinidion resinicola]KAF2809512.1 hypothetical protein BDZ99DRAFT_388052 [Mytilinidion resinicola]